MYAFDADVRVWLTWTYKRRRSSSTISFFATIWGQGTNATMQLCSGCNQGRHATCFHIPPREWVCEANKCWCTHLIDTSLYTETFIRYDKFWCDDMETTNHTQLCYSAMYAQRGRHTTCLINSIEGMGVWGKQMLMYAFDRHKLIHGGVHPEEASSTAMWDRDQRNNATLQRLQRRTAYDMPSKPTKVGADWRRQMLMYA